MAPWFKSSPSRRTPPHRPVGDIGISVTDPVTPDVLRERDTLKGMHFPAGDIGIADDCSHTFMQPEFEIDRFNSSNSVDQEASIAAIMQSGRPVGVTAPRPIFPDRRWQDMNFTHQREDDYLLFAPLPCPNDSRESSPRNSPRGFGEAFVGDHYVDMSPYVFENQKYDDLGAPSPAPTNPCRPGLELPTSPQRIHALGTEFPRHYDRSRHISRRSDDAVEAEIGHLDICLNASQRHHPFLQAPPMILPVPTGQLEREESSPRNAYHNSGFGAHPHVLILPVPPEPEPSAPSQTPAVRPPVRERSPDVFPEGGGVFGSLQRQSAPNLGTAMKNRAHQPSLKKAVSFSNFDSMYDVVPYSEVYGDHPKNFHFDADGNMVSNASLIHEWGAQAHSFGSEARMFDTYNRRYRMDEQMMLNEAEPLF